MLPRVLILRAPGTNCDVETAHAFALAGGAPDVWHVNRALAERKAIADFQILCLPGGFSYGDDVAAGRILGNQMQHHLADALQEFRDAGKLIIGICNGFQVLMKTDLLLASDRAGFPATLAANDSGHFEDRWIRMDVASGKCPFLAGIQSIELPIAHGEGRFVPRDDATLQSLRVNGQIVLRYAPAEEKAAAADGSAALPYPDNPNGSTDNIAGICDTTGRVFGLMPHPERFVDPTQHPTWTRGPAREAGDGLKLFENAVRYFR